jgi:hypothetical protein
MKLSEAKESLCQTALDAYRDDYDKLTETWRSLENKAQGNVAIAGIFLAGAFAFIREIGKGSHLYEKLILSFTITSLVIGVILSVLTLRIRLVAFPPVGENVHRLVRDLLRINDAAELLSRMPLFFNDRIAEWRIVNKAVSDANRSKARHLWRAQLFLLAAILMIAVLLISKTFYHSS